MTSANSFLPLPNFSFDIQRRVVVGLPRTNEDQTEELRQLLRDRSEAFEAKYSTKIMRAFISLLPMCYNAAPMEEEVGLDQHQHQPQQHQPQQQQQQQHNNENMISQIQHVSAIFPQMNRQIIIDHLLQNGGNLELCVNNLLAQAA